MAMALKDKVVLITGGNSGIGEAVTDVLYKKGQKSALSVAL